MKTLRKEKPMLVKLLYCDLRSQFLFYSPKSLGYFGKLMKVNSERSEMSRTYCITIIIMYPLELLVMKSRLR